ncbi:hypothetical protein, partial [Plantactinospora endophytica]|uniref:hypothetical protein n=1 Tax=Plantactinospora endophytica TaxID=673535 RepID=UPI00363E58F3
MANTVSQRQTRRESSFQFEDNRPKAIAQRKFQEMVNNSPQTKKTAQLKIMANNNVIQRMYNFEGMTYSQNALYGIKDSDSTKLYTDKEAKGPS